MGSSTKLALGVLCSIMLAVGIAYSLPQHLDSTTKNFPTLQFTGTDPVLAERTVVDHAIVAPNVVAYSYLGDKVPDKIAPDEVRELRTAASYTEYLGTVKQGEDPTLNLKSRVYSKDTFATDPEGQWHVIEHATTTQQAWLASRSFAERVRDWIVPTALATNIQVQSSSGDGHVLGTGTGNDAAEAVCLAAAWNSRSSGNGIDVTSVSMYVTSVITSVFDSDLTFLWNCQADVQRGFLPFNTGAVVPANATISAVALGIYAVTTTDGPNDGTDYITVLESTQASNSTLTNSDVAAFTGSTESIDAGSRADITSISTSAYTNFTFNSTGIGRVKKNGETSACGVTTGYTCVGLKEGHDYSSTRPTQNLVGDGITMYTSEQTGTANDPYLDITYTAPASAVAKVSGLKIASFGKLKVTGGGVKIK